MELQNAAKDPSEIKIAWLLEPRAINPRSYGFVQSHADLFDVVLTYDRELIKKGRGKFLYYPHGGCWIKDEDIKVYPKTKLVSIISSDKNQTVGHRLRHRIIGKYPQIDVYGRGYNPIKDKLEGLKDYMFSVVVENSQQDDYFTEKLIDVIATGTVPIYWGTDSINDYFNDIITFQDMDDLEYIMAELSEGRYHEEMDNITSNMEIIENHKVAEDYIYTMYKNYLE